MSNEKELEQIKVGDLSKLKNLIPNFRWDVVATSRVPEKIIFNFYFHELTSSEKHLIRRASFCHST